MTSGDGYDDVGTGWVTAVLDELSVGGPPAPTGPALRRRVARRRQAAVAAAAVLLTVAGVGLSRGLSGGQHHRDIVTPLNSPPPLPAGARPLPGARHAEGNTLAGIGVLAVLRGSDRYVGRTAALEAYDSIPGAASRQGRVVHATLARLAFVGRSAVQHEVMWVVAVWYHHANIGTAPQSTWCVTYGFVNATTGRGTGYRDTCLPVGYRPALIR